MRKRVNREESPEGNGNYPKGEGHAPQTHLRLTKLCYSASTFVVKIINFLQLQTVLGHLKKDTIWDTETRHM